ncbi:MAG: hypothetical protein JXB32_03520 [Deltaproteobacteria bacterium]|nr:hypothetical protein [Deltaproteobacteria bacterium]
MTNGSDDWDDDGWARDDGVDDEVPYVFAAEPRGLIRCPLCGMVRPAQFYNESVVERQPVERCHRESLGGRRGFLVHRGLDLSQRDIQALQFCAIIVLRHLRAYARDIGAGVIRFDDDEEAG